MKHNHVRVKILSIFWILVSVSLHASSVRIYVANHAGTTISVVDPETNTVVGEIKDIEVPEAVRFSPDGSRIFITQGPMNGPTNVLTVLNRKTGELVAKVPITGHANEMTVTPDGKLILVCIADLPGALDIIDSTSLQKIKTVPVESRLHDVVVTQDGKYAVATSPEGKFAVVFDLESEQIAWYMRFDQGALVPAIESNPDGSPRRLFLNLTGTRGFAVIDFQTHQEVTRIKFPEDEPTVSSALSPSHGLGIAPNGKTLWAVSRIHNCVFVYSLPDLHFLGRVPLPKVLPPGHDPVGGYPNWITFTPDGKKAYVSSSGDMSVSAIDTQTLKPVARIPMGEQPARMTTVTFP
jgi:YVTN family beta-propeller protein